MSLEEFTPEIEASEGDSQSAEKVKDSSEKYKESSKKAGAKVAKTQKDEKKAKKYDFLLAGFLVKIIVDKKYDTLLEILLNTIKAGYPSNFVLGILSLINIEVSNKIRENNNKELIEFSYSKKSETEQFDDHHIDSNIKNRINNWIEDIVSSITLEYSSIQTQKLKDLLKSDEKILLTYTSKTFSFFLNNLNVNISSEKAINISEFIVSDIEKNIDKLEIEKI